MRHGLRRSLVTPAGTHWLLVVASDEAVVRASQEVAAFLTFRRARLSPADEERGRSVIGIWVDSTMVDAVPSVLDVASATCPGQFHVRESIGMNGIWSLWWLDVESADAATAVDTVCGSLIATLAAIRPPRDDGRVARFVPVFGLDQHPLAIHVEMNRLRELFPRLIGEPVTWDSTTGALLCVSGPQSCDGP